MQLSFELLSFILSIVSLIISGGAVWLSLKFYQMSDDASKEAKKSSDKIQTNTDKLEGLFNKLYTDTFSMMKDTVSDMRKHIYHRPEESNSIEARLSSMKNEIESEFKDLIDVKLKDTTNNGNEIKIQELERDIAKILNNKIDKVIDENGSKQELIKERAISILSEKRIMQVKEFVERMKAKYGYTDEDHVQMCLFDLRESDFITWEGNRYTLSFSDIIVLK
ncbi:hypothetical protein PO856_003473 [Pectobacterium brasiliense]|uniref:hypothetical protein n=1 Tax=Pectobacterium brasiliense TaxID=180957 RepID=UPI0024073B59|nr:hypothetical protein [Pectobacterium brasiliense]MDG0806203.1 hypothetical protein [Pectobacterium brasiliense]